MDSYQSWLYDTFSAFRPSPTYPTYPPYHEGPYLEDYFISRFAEDAPAVGRYFIPVSWTTCYVENRLAGLQERLSALDASKSYFTVAQHDDAIREALPPDTISFNAGGNGGGIPIPLICSPIRFQGEDPERDIFCSFVGSLTHPVRVYLAQTLGQDPKYVFSTRQWTSSVSGQELDNFVSVTRRSRFALVPRGYGRSSFRLYEVMQLGAIPVFVYDEPWFPFEDSIDWDGFSVRIHFSQVHLVDSILSQVSPESEELMRSRLAEVWESAFTMESVYDKIVEEIKTKNG